MRLQINQCSEAWQAPRWAAGHRGAIQDNSKVPLGAPETQGANAISGGNLWLPLMRVERVTAADNDFAASAGDTGWGKGCGGAGSGASRG